MISNLFSQETFFKFLPGGLGKKVYEYNNSYKTISINKHFDFSNFLDFSELSLIGDSITNWSFELDTCLSTEALYSQCFTNNNLGSKYIAGTIVGEESGRLYGFLSKFTPELNIDVWTKSFYLANQGNSFRVITFKNDTSLILGSYNKNNNDLYTTFLETDTSGVIRWQKDFDCAGDCNMKPFHILPTEDNGFIFTCFESHINGQPGVDDFQTAVIKTDSLGNTQWRHTWGGDTTKNVGSWVVPLDDGNFLFAWTNNDFLGWNSQANTYRTIHFIKFDIDGNTIWYKDLSNYIQDEWYYISQMELMPDGNIIIGIDGYIEGAIIKIDQEAVLIWYRKLMPPGLSYEENTASAQHLKILGVTFTSDDGFILAGEYFSSPGNMFPEVYQSAFAYKLDEYGCFEPGCNVHDDIEVLESNKAVSFTLHPNPANNFVVVEGFTSTSSATERLKIASLAIYDVMGKLLKTISLNEDPESQTVDVSDLESGIYLVKIGEQMEKLVVE